MGSGAGDLRKQEGGAEELEGRGGRHGRSRDDGQQRAKEHGTGQQKGADRQIGGKVTWHSAGVLGNQASLWALEWENGL